MRRGDCTGINSATWSSFERVTPMTPIPSIPLPVGANLQADDTARFTVWAPKPRAITLVVEDGRGGTRDVALTRDRDGYATTSVSAVAAGQRYWYRVDDRLVPDPASRWQPDGPFGPSVVVDATQFRWTDAQW